MQSINAGFGGAATNKQGAVFAGAKIARNEAVGPSLPCLPVTPFLIPMRSNVGVAICNISLNFGFPLLKRYRYSYII